MNLNLFIAKKMRGKEGSGSLNGGISVVSITVSVLIIFIAIAIIRGFKSEVGAKAVGFSGEILFVAPGMDIVNETHPINSALSFLPSVKALKAVSSVEGVAYKHAMARTDENVQGILFKGVDSLYNQSFFEKHLKAGVLPNFSGKRISNDVLLSQRLCDIMGYQVGDDMIAYFIGERVSVRRFKITGIYDAQLEELDKVLTLIDIRHIQRLNGWKKGEVSTMEVSLKKGSDREDTINSIDDIVSNETADDDSPIVVKSIRNIYPHLYDWLDLMDLNVLIVLILMIVVAGFNMISGLLIILFDKISMIGLLKALGMNNSAICKVFIYRSSFIIFKGMLWGNVIAIVLTILQNTFHLIKLNPQNYFVEYIPMNMDIPTFLVMNAVAFAIMMLIMIIPSLFISKVSPAKTIKMD